MKVTTMIKVPARETAEQIRSVIDMAHNCLAVGEGDITATSEDSRGLLALPVNSHKPCVSAK